jgi:uncharacterized membrane protein
MSLISPEATTLLWAILIALMGFGFWAEQHTRLGRLMTGVIVAMAAAMLLANTRVIPNSSPVYDTVFGSILPLAIPLLLFRANLREVLRSGGPVLWAFAIGAVGVVLGVFIAAALVPLGELKAIAAGLYTATYTGGSANFSAVAIATDFSEGSDLTAMLAADIIATNLQTMLLIALPGIAVVQRLYGSRAPSVDEDAKAPEKPFVLSELNLAGASLALALAFFLVHAGDALATMLSRPSLAILITSALALLLANLARPVVEKMSGDFEMGTFMVFLFLVAIAAGADLWVLAETGPVFMVYTGIVLAVHTAFVLIVAALLPRRLKLDIRALVIGSTACVGGVSTASAIASAKGWRDLVAPGIMAGTAGYAVGSFLGVWVWSLFS